MIIVEPVIGITAFCKGENRDDYGKVRCSYINAISEAGGRVILIPQMKDEKKAETYLDLIDGLVLSGGTDVSPAYYGEKSEVVKDINNLRDKWEFELFKHAYSQDIPVLGICRGMQLINVALGGTLYQDINKSHDDKLHHWPEDKEYITHYIEIKKESKLYRVLCSEKIKVNSYHHQAIKELALPLDAIAIAEDGIIEAVEAVNKKFIIGVQWHPEDLINNQPCFLKAFKMLVNNANKNK